jgi:hypothetical protein
MSRDEMRALIGGYATSSLSEAERRALFEAALEDQELFDELAREQALKEAIELPGAREQLLRSLTPPVPWWQRRWVWAIATAAAVIIVIFALRPAHHVEIARVEPPPAPVPQLLPRFEKAAPKVARARVAPRPPVAPSPEKSKAAAANAPEPEARDQKTDVLATGAIAGFAPSSAAPAPVANRLLAAPFALRYTIDWQGDAVITPLANGYLSIVAGVTLFPTSGNGEVRAGTPTRTAIPEGTDSIVIQFTATPPDSSTAAIPLTESSQLNGVAASPDGRIRLKIAK